MSRKTYDAVLPGGEQVRVKKIIRKRQKMPALTRMRMADVAMYWHNNPNLSAADVAMEYGCTTHQVRYAKQQSDAGLLNSVKRKDYRKRRPPLPSPDWTTDKLFDNQLDLMLRQLQSEDVNVTPTDRMAILEKYQKMTLTHHLKIADAEFVAQIIRRFAPKITDSEIIKIVHEEQVKWRNSR